MGTAGFLDKRLYLDDDSLRRLFGIPRLRRKRALWDFEIGHRTACLRPAILVPATRGHLYHKRLMFRAFERWPVPRPEGCSLARDVRDFTKACPNSFHEPPLSIR